MLWVAAFPAASGWLGYVRDPLQITFFGVNLPEAVVGNGLLGVMIEAPDAVKASVASVAVWLMWFGVILFWEKRAAKKPVVGLGIGTLE